ncbi:TPA: DUF905 domain-containing protein [Escherichia coli]|nr:DUF905 domain-containing protein [Escherichia coli]
MPGYTEYVLAEGSFSYGQAVAVITAYRNVFIQDDPGMHFRRVIRNMGRIVVDVDGVNLAELINKVAENGDSLRVVDERDSTETPATYASPHQLL